MYSSKCYKSNLWKLSDLTLKYTMGSIYNTELYFIIFKTTIKVTYKIMEKFVALNF